MPWSVWPAKITTAQAQCLRHVEQRWCAYQLLFEVFLFSCLVFELRCYVFFTLTNCTLTLQRSRLGNFNDECTRIVHHRRCVQSQATRRFLSTWVSPVWLHLLSAATQTTAMHKPCPVSFINSISNRSVFSVFLCHSGNISMFICVCCRSISWAL